MFDLCSLSLWCIPGCRCSFPIGCLIHWVHSRSLLQTVWLRVFVGFVGNVIPVTFKIHIGLSFSFPKLESFSTLPTSTYIIIHLAHLHIYHIHTNFWYIFMNYKLSYISRVFPYFWSHCPFPKTSAGDPQGPPRRPRAVAGVGLQRLDGAELWWQTLCGDDPAGGIWMDMAGWPGELLKLWDFGDD